MDPDISSILEYGALTSEDVIKIEIEEATQLYIFIHELVFRKELAHASPPRK